MNTNYWTVTGYGVDAEELCPSVDAQIAFIKKYLPTQYKEMQEDGEKCENCDMSNTSDCLDYCGNWINEYEDAQGDTVGFPGLFAIAIQENEDGFNPEYFHFEEYGAVLYKDRLPWEMTDRVKNMRAEDMAAIFQKYLNELGISASVSRQSVEFYG